MPEKNSSDGTLNLKIELCFNSGKKKFMLWLWKYMVIESPPPPLGSKIFKISLGKFRDISRTSTVVLQARIIPNFLLSRNACRQVPVTSWTRLFNLPLFHSSWFVDLKYSSNFPLYGSDGFPLKCGLVHTYPDINENGDFFHRFRKNTRPHVAYSNRFRRSTRKR